MNKIEFFKEFKKLCEYYNNKIYEDKELTTLYYENVKNTNLNEFKKQLKELIKTNKYMPKIADFYNKRKSNFTQRNYSDLESYIDIGG